MTKVFSTAELAALLNPISLVDALDSLQSNGKIESYSIEGTSTVIILSKMSEILAYLKEYSETIENPRPYVANKRKTT